MEFKKILERFRSLGGIADNVELRYGSFGKGLFPINPALPVKIVTPSKLLISPTWIKLNKHDQIRFKYRYRLKVEAEIISFFEDYQAFFGWGNGGIDYSRSRHNSLRSLPEKIKHLVLLMGWIEEDFEEKSTKDYLNDFLLSRQIRVGDQSMIMPIVDLINHSKNGKSYIADNGVRFEGLFKDEVFANYYRNIDAFHFLRSYGIASESATVLSCDVNIEIPQIGLIKIARFDRPTIKSDGGIAPRVVKKKSHIGISFLEIADRNGIKLPRLNFIEQLDKIHISKADSNKIFDGLIDHNIHIRKMLIEECKICTFKLARDLESVALNQLKLIEKN